MSLAVGLQTGEEICSLEVGEDVLDGWEIIGEGYSDELVDLMGEAERCVGGARKHVTDDGGESRWQCSH